MKRWFTPLFGGLIALVCASVLHAQVLKVEVMTPTNESALGFKPGTKQAKASATIAGGLVTGLTLVNAGSGYTSNPTLTFSGGSGTGATAAAVVGYSVASITLTNGGSGYASTPNVTIAAPGGSGTQAQATAVLTGDVVTGITITTAGSGYTVAPTVIIAPPTGAGGVTATATTALSATGTIKSVELTNPGEKYLTTPTLTITGGGGTGAVITVNGVTDVGVSSITLSDPGFGYGSAPTVTLVGGGGSGAVASAVLTASDGLVKSINVTSRGSGFISAPTVVIDPPDGVVVIKGRISGTSSIFTTTFFVDGKKVGELSDHLATEVSSSWTPPQPGSYYVTIKTVDKLNNEATSLPVRVFVEGTTIVSPVTGSIVPKGSSVVITAEATRMKGFIKQIEFFVEDPSAVKTSIGVDTTAPYSVAFTPPATGTYKLTAIATDNNDTALAESTIVPITVVTPIGDAPSVRIVNPIPGSSLSAGTETNVIADANDADGFINKVEFYLNGNLMGTAQTFPYTVTWAPKVAGNYTLVAMAFDDKGNAKASDPAAIKVKAGFPTVEIASPTTGSAAIIQGSKVPVTVRAAGSDGGITSLATINLLVDGVITDTLPKNPEKLDPPPPLTEPFIFDWASNVSLGSHVLAARVTDINGLSITSAEVPVTVIANQAPTVSLTNLTNGQTFPVGQTITMNATASDVDGSIAQVAFSVNGVQITGTTSYPNPDKTSPYSVQYTPPGVGTYTIQAVVTDNLGKTANSSTVSITVAPPVGATPYIGLAINDPSKDYGTTASTTTDPISVTYGSRLLLRANAMDTDGTITKVEFYVNGVKVAEDSSAPYNFDYLLKLVGSVEIIAVATDNDGNRVSSAPVAVTALPASGMERHRVTLSSPQDGVFYKTGQNIIFTASSTLGNASDQKIDFYWNNSQVNTTSESPYQFIMGISATGTYEIRAVARLGNFTTVSDPVTITVGDNQVPTVSLANPLEGAQVKSGVPLMLKANASDPDGSILNVEFMVNGNSVGKVTNPPYQYAWIPPSPGKYTVTAIATDVSQLQNVATPVNITATASAAPTVSLSSPVTGDAFKTASGIYLAATAADADGAVAYVRFYDNGTLLTKVDAAPYVHTFTASSPGVHTITAEAVDDSGNSTFSSPVAVSVENNAPASVSVTSPASGSSVPFGAKVNVSAFAYDPDASSTGGLTVEFFANGMSLGAGVAGTNAYLFSAPDWMPPSVGTWSIKARVTDKSGNVSTSAASTLTVTSPSSLTVALSGPSAGASYEVGSSVKLKADYTGGAGSVTVAFSANGLTKGITADTSDPTAATWKPTTAGTYDLLATVTDQSGVPVSSLPVRVTVVSDTAPVVVLTSPLQGQTYAAGSAIAFVANASDTDGLVKTLRFLVNNVEVATITNGLYKFNWVPTNVGQYSVVAEATDDFGNVTASTPVTILVSGNQAPTVALTQPTQAMTVVEGASIHLGATANDSDGVIQSVRFLVNGVEIGSKQAAPYTLDWKTGSAGQYLVKAEATDNFGQVASSASVLITVVANRFPTVSITTPSGTQTLVAGSTLNLVASAADPDGLVQQLRFLANGIEIGKSLTAPYTLAWKTGATGIFEVVAEAMDNQGSTTNSAPLMVVVTTNKAPTVTLTQPTQATQVAEGATLRLGATAVDVDGAIQSVRFLANGAEIGSKQAGPYFFDWKTTSPGLYIVKAEARDDFGNLSTSSEILVTVTANKLPTVSLTQPSANVSLVTGTTLNLSANATDQDGTIQQVRFLVNGVELGKVLSAPYTFAWKPLAEGSYSLVAEAMDNVGATSTTSSVTVTVTGNKAPTITLTQPTGGITVVAGATVNVSASASDADGTVQQVRFLTNGVEIAKLTAAPFNYAWKTGGEGSYTLVAEATDNVGATTTSSSASITVTANKAPTVSITQPANNATVVSGNKLNLSATATDPDGTVQQVRFLANGVEIAKLTQAPFVGEWTAGSEGSYKLVAEAMDNYGNLATSSEISVTVVANKLPTVQLTSPSSKLVVSEGSSQVFTATASDADGSIKQLRFLLNGVEIAKVMQSPFTTTWQATPAGTYLLTAEATDNLGGITLSSAVDVVVQANQVPEVVLTSPTSGAIVGVGSTLRLKATATDKDGLVKEVEFRANGETLGTVQVYPYEFDWKPSSEGTYVLTAVARDSFGATGTSAPVGIEVASRSSLTRYYSGTVIGGNETWSYALMVRKSSTAVFMAHTTSGTLRSFCFSGIAVDGAGVLVAKDGAGVERLRGTVNETGFVGTFTPDNAGLSFIGMLSQTGLSPVLPGLYSGSVLGVYDSAFSGLVLPDGRLFACLSKGTTQTVGSVNLGSGSSFALTAGSSAQIDGKFADSSMLVSGTVSGSLVPGQVAAAMSTGPELTDASIRGLSTRGWVGTGDRVMIAGFAVHSSSSTPVLLKATGPSLAGSVAQPLANPRMYVYTSSGAALHSLDSDDYQFTAALAAAFKNIGLPLPASTVEAASAGNLSSGAYAAVIDGVGGATGNAMIEVYDGSSAEAYKTNRIHAISTRAYVGTGDASLIAGFVIEGNMPAKVVIQAIGPTLLSYDPKLGAANVLQDPVLRLIRLTDSTVLRENDDWTVGNEARIVDESVLRGGANNLSSASKDAAMVVSLPPGVYGAVVSGKNGGTGIALIQVYEVR